MPAIVYRTEVYNMVFMPNFFDGLVKKYGRPLSIIFDYKGAYGLLTSVKIDDILDTYVNVDRAKEILDYREADNPVRIYWDELKPVNKDILCKVLHNSSNPCNKPRESPHDKTNNQTS